MQLSGAEWQLGEITQSGGSFSSTAWRLHTRASYLQLRLPLAFLSCCRVLKGICGERCNARWRHRQTDRRRGRQTDTERNAACSDKTGKEVWVGFLWQPHTSPRFAHMYTHTHRHTRPAKAWRVKEMFVIIVECVQRSNCCVLFDSK